MLLQAGQMLKMTNVSLNIVEVFIFYQTNKFAHRLLILILSPGFSVSILENLNFGDF